MAPSPPPHARKIGVLSRSPDRYQEIARAIDRPCVWLSGAEWVSVLETLDTVIIDSEMLSGEPGLTESLKTDAASWKQASICPQGEGILSYAAHLSRARNVVIFQCGD